MIQDLASFISYWQNARSRTLRVLEALEPEDLDWAPGPDTWTFGDLFRHLGGLERGMFAENARGRSSTYPGHDRELAPDLEALRTYLDRCHAETLAILCSLDDAALQAPCQTAAGAPMATWKWLRAMAEHEAHHRGQLYLMASLRGRTVAPLFGLTEEEVTRRSLSTRQP
jgi:uncharacterized damage-inducible protein DinB